MRAEMNASPRTLDFRFAPQDHTEASHGNSIHPTLFVSPPLPPSSLIPIRPETMAIVYQTHEAGRKKGHEQGHEVGMKKGLEVGMKRGREQFVQELPPAIPRVIDTAMHERITRDEDEIKKHEKEVSMLNGKIQNLQRYSDDEYEAKVILRLQSEIQEHEKCIIKLNEDLGTCHETIRLLCAPIVPQQP